jgi:hypothetical protein
MRGQRCECEHRAHEREGNGCGELAARAWPSLWGLFLVCLACDDRHRPPPDLMAGDPRDATPEELAG